MEAGRSKKISVREDKEISIHESRPSDWFEELYSEANNEGAGVPWANMQTHPRFAAWLNENKLEGGGNFALVIGCGMGDDAIELESLGFDVTAFDVSGKAIKYCLERFPDSKVNFLQADLFEAYPEWIGKFDFVLEIYTVQAIPPDYEKEVIQKIADTVAPDGQLLVVAEVGEEERSFDNGPPWMLTPMHVDTFASCGLDVTGQKIEKDGQMGSDSYVTTFKRVGA